MERPHEIEKFQEYVEKGDVKKRSENPSQARNLLKRAKSKHSNMQRLGISDETATDYVENLYESVKMLVQSTMALNGYKPYSHEAIIAYGIDLLELDMVTASSLNRYRKLRNDIAYRGEIATVEEAEDVERLYKELEPELKSYINKEIQEDKP